MIDRKNIIFHADDFGVSDQVSEQILDCVNNGVVSGVSMICNTDGFAYAKKLFNYNSKRFNIRLHLNLVEGKPVANSSDVSLLLNKDGEFCSSFISLWIKFLFSSLAMRKKLKSQIEAEIRAQLKLFRDIVGETNLVGIDSHTHIHMIPFVFNILLDISEAEHINFIRIPNEPFFLDWKSIKHYFSSNMLKHLLLNFLSKMQKKKVHVKGITCNEHFIGVLSTGRMSVTGTVAAIKKIKQSNSLVEVLFHPGGVSKMSDAYWTGNGVFKRYYSSPNRKLEAELLKNDFPKMWERKIL